MSDQLLADIVEVQTLSSPNANQYLNNGYILLGIYPISMLRNDNSGGSFVQNGVTFVVGRDEGTKHFEIPRRNGN